MGSSLERDPLESRVVSNKTREPWDMTSRWDFQRNSALAGIGGDNRASMAIRCALGSDNSIVSSLEELVEGKWASFLMARISVRS
jgi:hypothetical protein